MKVHTVRRMDAVAASNPFDTIGGLPVHVLVVHLVVILLPLAAIGAIVIGLIPKASLKFGILVWIAAGVSLGACVVAERSGKQLAQRVGVPREHMQLGEQVKYYAAALFVISFVMWIIDRQTGGRRSLAGKIVAGVMIIAAIAAIYGAFRAGDTGARAVWAPIVENTNP